MQNFILTVFDSNGDKKLTDVATFKNFSDAEQHFSEWHELGNDVVYKIEEY